MVTLHPDEKGAGRVLIDQKFTENRADRFLLVRRDGHTRVLRGDDVQLPQLGDLIRMVRCRRGVRRIRQRMTADRSWKAAPQPARRTNSGLALLTPHHGWRKATVGGGGRAVGRVPPPKRDGTISLYHGPFASPDHSCDRRSSGLL